MFDWSNDYEWWLNYMAWHYCEKFQGVADRFPQDTEDYSYKLL